MILQDKTVLITGGTGSLGKKLVQRILSGEQGQPNKVIVFSRDEAKQHELRLSYLHKRVTTDEVIFDNFRRLLEFRIGDIRNYSNVCGALRDADIVLNAAALKQVPTCEYFPEQAILTNCLGAVNIIRAIREQRYSVESIVGISTDKACKPINVMGMTKALQERLFVTANIQCDTRFVCVRYGNVLASRGSVVPFFHEQIRHNSQVPVTSPEMTRFLISLDEAVNTIFAALNSARPGEIYVPEPPSVSIMTLARALIGDRNLEIKVVGVRPGEKLHEILVSEEEAPMTFRRGNYLAIQSLLPELQSDRTDTPALTGAFSSADNILDLQETLELLRNNSLLVDQVPPADNQEILR